MTLQIYVRYLVSSPCVVTPGGLETKRPVSELYGRSGSPAAPRVTITSSPASAGLLLVRFRTILVWNGFLPLAFVIYRTNGAMGCDDQGRRVSRQGTRVRRTRRTDARFLYQGTIPRSCEEVAPDGRTRRQSVRQGVCPPRRNRASLDHTNPPRGPELEGQQPSCPS